MIIWQPNNSLLLYCTRVAEIGRPFIFYWFDGREGDEERDSFVNVGEGTRFGRLASVSSGPGGPSSPECR